MNHKEREIQENMEKLSEGGMFHGGFDIINGVMMWTSNGNVPFDDMLEAAIRLGHPVDMEKSQELRNVQQKAAIQSYIKGRQNMSAEQKREEAAERRAAFGPGVDVVDAISGERYRT